MNIHKTLGIVSMSHYFYRFYQWNKIGFIYFDKSLTTLALITVHAMLSLSSMIFTHLPAVRNKMSPMIWPEFRLHSILFAMRSLTIMYLHWFGLESIVWRCLVVLTTMILTDEVTRRHPPQGSTMRVMPYPWEKFSNVHNLFYSVCQVYATLEVLIRNNPSNAFMVLFPIQLAAFLMTCVRKSIITSAGWHMWYTLSLLTTALYAFKNREYALSTDEYVTYNASALLFFILRFGYNVNKYKIWIPILIQSCIRVPELYV